MQKYPMLPSSMTWRISRTVWSRQFRKLMVGETAQGLRRWFLALLFAIALMGSSSIAIGQFIDKSADPKALPKVPAEFQVTLFASEPLVRQPCSMAFDERGRLFVGMGPQYRNPTPKTPGDSVVIVQDTNGDGHADRIKKFAIGLNAIQGLAWHGRDLWIANAPDLTMVRDLDGDDVADEYVRVYTDLGNLEHGLHGLTWAPDGKLYMSKGNSKGLTKPGRIAPKPFRDLWGVTAPLGTPDFPPPQVFSKHDYQHAYHDPADDWGLDGGILRCDGGGQNLEIVSRGFRNPWDITLDSGFNWLGTDNDQTTGDRVFMPFFGAHFGWNHPWSSHWSSDPHAPTAPVSGPLFEGSGTGVVYCQSPQFPPEYRNAFLVNDWLLKKTYLWRPRWDGALLRPEGGSFIPFVEGGSSLFRPTDMEFGPDGALWVLGWSSGYGAEWKDGQLANEGRIFRIAWKDAPAAAELRTDKLLDAFTIDELIHEFDSLLPVRRINAQDELVRRGKPVVPRILQRLSAGRLTENQETWSVWALGRIPGVGSFSDYLLDTLSVNSKASLNLQVQAVRILAYRAKQLGQTAGLATGLHTALRHRQPRLRFAAVGAMHETRQSAVVPELLATLQHESDTAVFYAGWQALRALQSTSQLRTLLSDSRSAVRRAALLGLLETHASNQTEVRKLAEHDPAADVREVAELWLAKNARVSKPEIRGRALSRVVTGSDSNVPSSDLVPVVRNVKARSGLKYHVVPGGFSGGIPVYADRAYRLSRVPPELEGCDLLQTANNDDGSRGDQWLTAEALVPVKVWVGIDDRQKNVPRWLQRDFESTSLRAVTDEGATFLFHVRTFAAGPIALGGNTNDGRAGGKGNYVVAIAPLPLGKPQVKTTLESTLAILDRGDRERGEVLFRHAQGAGCAKCHSLDQSRNGFGPNLRGIGMRTNARHIVQSMIEPSEVITEGFNQLTVLTDAGLVYSGVLLEESGLTLSLGQSNGQRIEIPKATIERRKTSRVSAMPEMATSLTPQQVADLATFLLSLRTAPPIANAESKTNEKQVASGKSFGVEEQRGRLHISLNGKPIVDFVFHDDKILRPYFANARLTDGLQVTRNHPPIKKVDAVDHETMHPGIWLGFGDLSGEDFWRNKGSMEHVRFVTAPTTADGRLRFSTQCRLKSESGVPLALLINKFTLVARPNGWMLIWDAAILADQRPLVFGDQEEMGFGARMATPFTEKNGGVLRSSTGKKTASATWGQPAAWCDYSGTSAKSGGIMLMANSTNFRESWWHNRDYGVFVANPFGRQAMKQGARSEITVAQGETLRIRFGALVHDHRKFNKTAEFEFFRRLSQPDKKTRADTKTGKGPVN